VIFSNKKTDDIISNIGLKVIHLFWNNTKDPAS